MNKIMNKIRVNFHLTKTELNDLKILAQQREVSVASLIRQAIDIFLRKNKDK